MTDQHNSVATSKSNASMSKLLLHMDISNGFSSIAAAQISYHKGQTQYL